jgi:small conductance mechanosensitive channel
LGAQLQSLVDAPPAVTAEGDEANQEPPPTFGTRALNVVINITEIFRGEAQRFVSDFSAFPQLSDWVAQQRNDPRLAARWVSIGSDGLATAGIAFLGALALEFLLYPLRRILRKRSPRGLAARLAVVFSLFFLRAIPIMVFVATSVVLLNAYDVQKLSRFMIMNLVYALALARTAVSFLRGVLSPKSDALRFVPVTKEQAIWGFRWLSAFGLLILFGYFCTVVVRAVHMPEASIEFFVSVLGLILVVMGIVVIAQSRSFVAQFLRGNLSAAQPDLTWFESLRLWLARRWSVLAIGYLVIGYAVAATGVQDGLVLMLRGTLLTLSIFAAVRILFHDIALWEARSKKGSTTFYALIKGAFLRTLLIALAILGSLAAWGVDLVALAALPIGHRLLGSAFSIGFTLFVLGLVYEFFSATVDRQLTPRSKADGRVIEVNARSRTLLPMMRNALFVLFLAIIGVVVLSEAGINIGPLIAGAGVLGVAVGFGSQTLVKDFLTGLFIVLENTIAVGDVIKIGDQFGAVEAMSMRTLRLRDTDGALHIVPFSEVSKITNQSRGFSHAVIKVNLALEANLDNAIESIRAVGLDLQADDKFKNLILEPVEILGVDSINDASVTLLARVRTRPGKQWDVKRIFLMRLKQRFDKDGILLPSWTSIKVEKN